MGVALLKRFPCDYEELVVSQQEIVYNVFSCRRICL